MTPVQGSRRLLHTKVQTMQLLGEATGAGTGAGLLTRLCGSAVTVYMYYCFGYVSVCYPYRALLQLAMVV